MTSEVTRRTACRPRSAGNHLANTLLQASNTLTSRTTTAAVPRIAKHTATSSSSSSNRRPQTAPAARVRFSATAVIAAATTDATTPSAAEASARPMTADHKKLSRQLTSTLSVVDRTTAPIAAPAAAVAATATETVIGRVSANGRSLLTSHSEGILSAASSVQGEWCT
jgi:hypothetical protein